MAKKQALYHLILTTTATAAANNQSSTGDFDSFTEVTPIKGNLLSGSILHLIDFTPGSVVNDGDAHIPLKAPCDDNGNSKVTLMAGAKPDFKSVKLAPSINNGTLDGNPIPLSIIGYSCLYHADIPAGTVDIAIMNTSNETLAFDNDGYMAGVLGVCAY